MHSLVLGNDSKINESLYTLFEKNNVKVLFTGNAEGYSHIQIGNIHCFSTGEKSFSYQKQNHAIKTLKLVKEQSFIAASFEGDDLTITVFNADMEIIDTYSIE